MTILQRLDYGFSSSDAEYKSVMETQLDVVYEQEEENNEEEIKMDKLFDKFLPKAQTNYDIGSMNLNRQRKVAIK